MSFPAEGGRRSARLIIVPALVLGLAGPAGAQLVDGVAAIVEKDVILLSELELAARVVIEQLESQQQAPLPPETVREVYQDALQSLIDTKLIERFADRVELAATDQDVDYAVESIARDEGVEVETIYAAAAREGLSREAYRRELGRQITRMKVISSSIQPRVKVNDEEVQELFEQRYREQSPGMRARVRHILLPWPGDGDPEKRERMRAIAAQIRERAIESGEFAELARQYSRAPSAADGGLTMFREGEVAPAIGAQVFSLPPGEITPLIETEHGLNIFQVLNRFDPSEIAFEDVEVNLRAELIERKTMPEFRDWVKGLRENRYIEIILPELR